MNVNGWRLPEGEEHFVNYARKDAYQATMLDLALGYVRDATCAVDAGAHVGFHSRKLTARFDEVWAFEPVPENYACLAYNAPAAKAVRVALGKERGDMTLTCPAPGNSGSWERGEGITVPVMTLDDYPIERVDFVKIDVQGMETDVLLGGENLIRRCKPVIAVEVVLRGEVNPEIEALLESWGATVFAKVGKDIVAGWI